jgi:hypothetical protein
MCRAECIVDEDITIRGETCSECGIILLFARVETHVLKEEQLARTHATHCIFCADTECVTCCRNVDLQELRKSLSRWPQA